MKKLIKLAPLLLILTILIGWITTSVIDANRIYSNTEHIKDSMIVHQQEQIDELVEANENEKLKTSRYFHRWLNCTMK